MIARDFLSFAGRVRILLLDSWGRVIGETWTKNFLTDDGEALIADRLSDRNATNGDIDYMAIGTGSGQTRANQTLANEVARVALDSTSQGTAGDDNDIIFQATFPAGTPGTDTTITEGALFNHGPSSGVGIMVNYFEIQPPHFKPTTLAIIVQNYWTVGAS